MRLFILLMLLSGAVQAGAYKCKDANGKTTYQQSPCVEHEAVKGYKFHEESEATKSELKRVANEKYEKRIAANKVRQASRVSGNSDSYRAAQSNLLAAKLNAKTQQQASSDAAQKRMQQMIDNENRTISRIFGFRRK